MPDSRCWSFRYSFFVSLVLVISVAHFSPEAPGLVVESVSSNYLELFYLMVGGFFVFYGLISRKGLVGNNAEVEMSLGFKASIDYVEEMLLNVESMRDLEFFASSYGDYGGVCGNAEWLGLPVRSLKSVVDYRNGVKYGNACFCEDGDRAFDKLSPVNLLEKFNEASALIKGRVGSCNLVSPSVASGGFADCFTECGNQIRN